MSGAMKSDTAAASQAAAVVKSGLGDYCSFRIKPISGALPVSGSALHDDNGAKIEQFLGKWSLLLNSDARDIEKTGASFKELDNNIARKLLGMDNKRVFEK